VELRVPDAVLHVPLPVRAPPQGVRAVLANVPVRVKELQRQAAVRDAAGHAEEPRRVVEVVRDAAVHAAETHRTQAALPLVPSDAMVFVETLAEALANSLAWGYVVIRVAPDAEALAAQDAALVVPVHVAAPAVAHAAPVAADVAVHAAAFAVAAVVVVILVAPRVVPGGTCKMKKSKIWQEGRTKNITFIVTKDCQLACKYCYLIGKNTGERMPWEIARQTVDYLLSDTVQFDEDSVVFEFIGGEPFLEIDLTDRICDYIKVQMFEKNHRWFNSYRFNFSTNGINYHEEKVQRFIAKNPTHLSIGITIDGTRAKHDLNRVYKNGKGTYDDVVKNIPLWLNQFPGGATKVTISSADIPYICESVLHLFDLGIKTININCVFEDVWRENDDWLFEEQLIRLADEIIDREDYRDAHCSFFSEQIGKPLDRKYQNQNWCGSGMMLSVDAAGNFYPCTRFAQYSLREKKAWTIGNVRDGINRNRLRPFLTLDRCTQSPQECIDCEVAAGCAWCQGENYDAAVTATIYQRATAICKMHKARVRANNYYWNKLFRKMEVESRKDKPNNVVQPSRLWAAECQPLNC